MAKMKKEEIPLPSINLDDDEGLTVDEALAKVAMILAGVKEPRTQSEIDEPEIRALASLHVVAEKMNDKMLKSFCNEFLLLRVSKNRKGRGELLDIARASRDIPEQKLGRLRTLFSGITGR
jgi:hypothetical protein